MRTVIEKLNDTTIVQHEPKNIREKAVIFLANVIYDLLYDSCSNVFFTCDSNKLTVSFESHKDLKNDLISSINFYKGCKFMFKNVTSTFIDDATLSCKYFICVEFNKKCLKNLNEIMILHEIIYNM